LVVPCSWNRVIALGSNVQFEFPPNDFVQYGLLLGTQKEGTQGHIGLLYSIIFRYFSPQKLSEYYKGAEINREIHEYNFVNYFMFDSFKSYVA